MNRLEKFNIDKAASEGKTKREIGRFLSRNKDGFIFEKVIQSASLYSDVVEYYLEASYICEEIAALGESKSFKEGPNGQGGSIVQFKIVPNQIQKLQELLYNFCQALSLENDDMTSWLIDKIEGYRESIEQRKKFHFPDLANTYFANLTKGAYSEYESNYKNPEEFVENVKKRNPEHLFGFRKYIHPNDQLQNFYVSSESWIVPPQIKLKGLLKKFSSIEKISFEQGNIFSLDGGYYVINKDYILSISFPALAKAFQCVSLAFQKEQKFEDQHNWLYHLNSAYKIEISDFADIVLLSLHGYRIILWNQHKLTFNDINLLNKSAATIFQTTAALIGLTETIACNWQNLNAESFEELCYDIIYYDPRFDNKTIKKMGKLNTRDGGIDIEVYTNARIGYAPEKYIFQCKLLKPGSSLTATKVLDISDIIEQSNAKGYGIFTSGIIDPTLYNKVDTIAKKKKIKTEFLSKLELERLLARLPKLKSRYFKNNP